MGLEELISTLKKNEQKQIEDIWQEAKAEAETLRSQINEAIADITRNHTVQLAAACQKSRRSIFSSAELKTLRKKLLTYASLGQALQEAAIKKLPALRNHDYEEVFALLVKELPKRKWGKIFVNPKDLALAAKFYSPDIIEPDETICGGLIATTPENKVMVDNTFTKRLERKWLQLLPAIIAKIEKQYGKTGSA